MQLNNKLIDQFMIYPHSLPSPSPNPHILTELSRVCGGGLHGPLMTFTDVCSRYSSSSSPYSSPCLSESSDSEVEDSECEEYVEGLDCEDGSAKCLEPDTESRRGWSGWNDTEPIASGDAKNQ